jgi:saccharopine dehydrogenase-like NADP-dependent oxidoreductase
LKNVLILGGGGVAQVAAYKCAQNNGILGNICIASRTQSKCDAIIDGIIDKGILKDKTKTLTSRQVNAMDVNALHDLITQTKSSIVLNLGSAFINMTVLEACLKAKVDYIDTAIHEEQDRVATICEPAPWYGNYEWKRKDRCKEAGINAVLGAGFDPGVVNAYCALAKKEIFDKIDTIDILDVNVGSHGKYFATNFDPEINFREFTGTALEWIDQQWVKIPMFTQKMSYDFPVVGEQTVYMTGHDELHSLSKNIDANSIRFWMGFSDHYINCFNVLKNIGLLSERPLKTAEGLEVIPLKVVKACLPDPKSLAPNYTGKTCIGCNIKGTVKKGRTSKAKEIFIYNVCDHQECFAETNSQGISYTAGVPAAATAILLAQGIWNPKGMVNVEELDPKPFIDLLNTIGIKTEIKDITIKRPLTILS